MSKQTFKMKGLSILKHHDSNEDLIIDIRIASEPDLIVHTVCGKWYNDDVMQELVKHQCDEFSCYYDAMLEVQVCTFTYPDRIDYIAAYT